MSVTTSSIDKARLLNDLKDIETRRLFYQEHISTGLPFQIRALRKSRGLTQKRLREITGFSQSNLSDWENPNYEYTPQIGTLMRLADAFDVPLIVRFGSWEEVWDWEVGLSAKKVAPPTFDEVLPKLEKKAARNRPQPTKGDAGQMRLFFEPVGWREVSTQAEVATRATVDKVTDLLVYRANREAALSTGEKDNIDSGRSFDLDILSVATG